MKGYIVLLFEAIIDEALNDAGLASAGIAQQDDLEGAFADGGGSDGHLNYRTAVESISSGSHSRVEGSLRFGQTHFGDLGLVGVAFGHVLVVLLLEGTHLVVLHGLGRHVLLLELLGNLIVHFLLLVVELVKLDLDKADSTFFWTSRLFLSARTRI